MNLVTIPKFYYSSIEVPSFTLPVEYVKECLYVLNSGDFTSLLEFHDIRNLIEINLRNTKLKEEIICYLRKNFPVIVNNNIFKPILDETVLFVKLGTRELVGLRCAWLDHLVMHLNQARLIY